MSGGISAVIHLYGGYSLVLEERKVALRFGASIEYILPEKLKVGDTCWPVC